MFKCCVVCVCVYLTNSEFFADIGKYWEFLDAIAAMDASKHRSDYDEYSLALTLASQLSGALSVSVLNYSLAIHAYSPKLEMFRHVLHNHMKRVQEHGTTGIESMRLSCSDIVFVVQTSRFSCGFTEDLLTFTSTSSSASPRGSSYDQQFPFDHVFTSPSSTDTDEDKSVPVVILYADLCSTAFKHTHKILSAKAASGDILYMVRPKFSSTRATAPLSLQGFGAMLAIKNMEYKVLDDSKIEYTDPVVSPDAIHLLDDIETDVNGFLFGTLLRRRPDLTKELQSFHDFLLRATKEDVHITIIITSSSSSILHSNNVNLYFHKT